MSASRKPDCSMFFKNRSRKSAPRIRMLKRIQKVVEEKDATDPQLKINEINSGICVLPYKYLATWLANLKPNNKQKELYLLF